ELGFTGVIVTHEVPRVFDIVDKVAFLREGKVFAYDEPEKFMASTKPEVKEFLAGSLGRPDPEGPAIFQPCAHPQIDFGH
ncbi:MAG: hypothetical protein B1H13_05175, partial [Desulfobacteraceae bacterium 4484_190.3]